MGEPFDDSRSENGRKGRPVGRSGNGRENPTERTADGREDQTDRTVDISEDSTNRTGNGQEGPADRTVDRSARGTSAGQNRTPVRETRTPESGNELGDDPFDLFTGEEMTEKHWRILEAAIRVFSEKGFSAARTSEIAKEAKVSEGTVFNYFRTKRDLLIGLLLPLFTRYFRPLAARSVEEIIAGRGERSLDQVLFDIMRDRIHLLRKNWPLVKTVAAEAAFHPELLDPVRERVAPYMMSVGKRFVQQEKARGTLRDVDEGTAVRAFMSLVIGYVLARNVFPDLFPWQDDDVEIRRMVDLYLYGVARKDAEGVEGAGGLSERTFDEDEGGMSDAR